MINENTDETAATDRGEEEKKSSEIKEAEREEKMRTQVAHSFPAPKRLRYGAGLQTRSSRLAESWPALSVPCVRAREGVAADWLPPHAYVTRRYSVHF
jgi:hypothetical protein